MITLLYFGRNNSIRKAIVEANEILSSDAFYEKIAALPQLTNTDLSSREVAQILKETERNITVATFWNPFSPPTRMIHEHQFRVNTKKISPITAFAVNTLVNETIQTISFWGGTLDFKSVDVESDEHTNCLPWRIGELAEIISRKSRRFA